MYTVHVVRTRYSLKGNGYDLTPHGIAIFVFLQNEGNLYRSSHVLDLENVVPECGP